MKILKKHLSSALAALALFVGASIASGQTATFSYDDGVGTPDAGSYTPGSSFTFSISLAFAPGGTITNLQGVTYYFQQQDPNPPFYFSITLRDASGSQFSLLQTPGLSYPQTLSPANANDLGGERPTPPGAGAGDYFIANITVSIDGTAAPGTYLIRNTTSVPKLSIISDDQGQTFAIPQATYAITVIPEPGTVSLLAFAGLSAAGIGWFRRKR
jgi:hypothetical protein